MKNTFFAGKFDKTYVNGQISLKNDYRTLLAGGEDKFTFANEGNPINDTYYYIGTFYNQKASTGELTSSDCAQVVLTEFKLIESCELFCAYLDSNTELSLGTVAELIYAASLQKDILIFYNRKEVGYEIKSEYWYPMIAAKYLTNDPKMITVIEINNVGEIYEYLGVDVQSKM